MSVYIKNILPDKMKIKLVIVNHSLGQSHRFDLHYFITEGISTTGCIPPPKAASALRQILRLRLAIRSETFIL